MTHVLAPLPVRVPRKITRRVMPFLFLLYITAFIDRVNVGFAGLQMTRDLAFSNEVFGFGAGVFFFGYCLLEIPGAMLAEVWSARKWIAAIMMGWGVLAALTGLIQNATQFNIIRFLLGVAEGGFFPSVVVYLTHWYRQADRAKAVAMFMTAIPVSNMFGAPIAGLLLRLNWLGLPGWRWLLILEGVPAFMAGVATLFYMTDRPEDARWLDPAERQWIAAELEHERRGHPREAGHGNLLKAFRHPVVLALAFSYFLINTTSYGLNIWLPKIVQKMSSLSTFEVSLVLAIPHMAAVPAMLATGWHSDKTGERRWHAALAPLTAALALGLSQWTGGNTVLSMAMFTVTTMAIMSYYAPFWALTTRLTSERSAAACVGFVNLVANLGGFAGPYAVGFLTDRTGSFLVGVFFMVATAVLAGLVLSPLGRARKIQPVLPGELPAEAGQ
jgi:ACS family tartrate transporter-like MFS transporter